MPNRRTSVISIKKSKKRSNHITKENKLPKTLLEKHQSSRMKRKETKRTMRVMEVGRRKEKRMGMLWRKNKKR